MLLGLLFFKSEFLALSLMWIYLSRGITQATNTNDSIKKSEVSPQLTDKTLSRSSVIDTHKEAETASNSIFHEPRTFLDNEKWPVMASRRSSSNPGWFGFNHFIPRSARQFPLGFDRTSLLGESTQLYPFVNMPSPFSNFNMNPNFAFQQQFNEMQQNFLPKPQNDAFLESQLVVIEQPMQMPPGFLVPIYRPRQPSFKNNHPGLYKNQQRQKFNLQPSQSAQNPVTIKIVPLKIASFDLTNVLKAMSFMPVSLDLLKASNGQNMNGNNGDRPYNDNKGMFDDEDESDLPPPSSHVATPLGITYAENMKSERYLNRYGHRG